MSIISECTPNYPEGINLKSGTVSLIRYGFTTNIVGGGTLDINTKIQEQYPGLLYMAIHYAWFYSELHTGSGLSDVGYTGICKNGIEVCGKWTIIPRCPSNDSTSYGLYLNSDKICFKLTNPNTKEYVIAIVVETCDGNCCGSGLTGFHSLTGGDCPIYGLGHKQQHLYVGKYDCTGAEITSPQYNWGYDPTHRSPPTQPQVCEDNNISKSINALTYYYTETSLETQSIDAF